MAVGSEAKIKVKLASYMSQLVETPNPILQNTFSADLDDNLQYMSSDDDDENMTATLLKRRKIQENVVSHYIYIYSSKTR